MVVPDYRLARNRLRALIPQSTRASVIGDEHDFSVERAEVVFLAKIPDVFFAIVWCVRVSVSIHPAVSATIAGFIICDFYSGAV